MNYNLFYKHEVVGLAISHATLVLLCLKQKNKKWQLTHLTQLTLPLDVLAEGKVLNWSAFKLALTQLVQEQHWQGRKVIACMPERFVLMHTLMLPTHLSASDITAEIIMHMQKDLPNVNFATDYCLLNNEIEDTMAVLFAATRDSYMQQYKEAIVASGMQLNIMDIDLLALLRCIQYLLKKEEKQPNDFLILIIDKNKISLIGFAQQKVWVNETWEVISQAHLYQTVNEKLTICLAQNKLDLQEIMLLCDSLWTSDLASHLTYSSHLLSLQKHFIIPSAWLEEWVALSLTDRCVALGLAMRAATPW